MNTDSAYSANVVAVPVFNICTIVDLKQGRIHGNAVADGWAGAVMQKPLGIQKCDGRTYLPTNIPTDRPTDTARCRVACPRLKITYKGKLF